MNTPKAFVWKRILCLLLAFPLAFGLCAYPAGEPGTTDGPGGGPDTPPQYIDNLGERNYNGEAFTVSVLDTYKNEVYAEEDTTEVLDEAVYKRNRRIEERFNVRIVPDITLPNMPDQAAHITYMQHCFNDGAGNFDVGLLMV